MPSVENQQPVKSRLQPLAEKQTGLQPKKAVTVLAVLLRLQRQCSRLQPLAENQTGVQLKKAVTPRLENHPVKMIPSVKVAPTHLTDGVDRVHAQPKEAVTVLKSLLHDERSGAQRHHTYDERTRGIKRHRHHRQLHPMTVLAKQKAVTVLENRIDIVLP